MEALQAAAFTRCAEALNWADGLLITAGAGMGVDSGLPDFRGPEGFWSAYPALREANVRFHDIASPNAFLSDPHLAWGFYGHRLKLYRETEPHEGFAILREFANHMDDGACVYTSNVDGHFQKAGFTSSRVFECHGSIHALQCLVACTNEVWPAESFDPVVDTNHCRLLSDLPRCSICGGLARPNILMFGDWNWLDSRSQERKALMDSWLENVKRLVIIEIGAGTALPGVRYFGEFQNGFLIRINPKDAALPSNRRGISLEMRGLEALRKIHEAWVSL